MPLRRLLFAAALASLLPVPLPARGDDVRMDIRPEKGPPPINVDQVDAQGVLSGKASGGVTAHVRAIDRAKREVTLHGDGGRVETMQVGPEVKNLEKLNVGDRVEIRYSAGLVLHRLAAGSEESAPEVSKQRKSTGSGDVLSGSEVVRARETVAVTGVDPTSRMVEMKDAQGTILRVKLGPAIDLAAVKVGDRFTATYYGAMAVAVDPTYRP